jgi:simple sugar transport system ATP-binding protein
VADVDVADAPALEATGVSVRFGKTRALDSANLAVRVGEVHGLIGRNGAGKSTLVSVISGLLQPQGGEIHFGGSLAPKAGHVGAWRNHIGTVFQKPMIATELSVLENLFLGAPILRRGGLVDWTAMRARATAALEEWGVEVDLGAPAGELTIGQQQLLEILRIMMLGPKVIVLDEPTAKLGRAEATILIEHIHRLRSRGISFVYVSHHLNEVLEVCDTVTVVRNGKNVWTRPAGEITVAHLTEAMSGGAVSFAGVIKGSDAASASQDGVVLRVDDLSTDVLEDISFAIRSGECVGLAGLKGSGNQEVGKVLAGLSGPNSGRIEIDGKQVRPAKVRAMLDAGVGYVSGDRHFDGFVPEMSISDNLSMAVLPHVSRFGFVDGARRAEMVSTITERLDVVASSSAQYVASLSGGNQQKVVLGRALASNPKLLVLDNPTAGVDIASRESLFGAVADACATGTAALVISDDEEELKRCGRILVMVKGRLSKELAGGCADSAIVAAMSEGN